MNVTSPWYIQQFIILDFEVLLVTQKPRKALKKYLKQRLDVP